MLIGTEKYNGFDYEIHLTSNDKIGWRERANHFIGGLIIEREIGNLWTFNDTKSVITATKH